MLQFGLKTEFSFVQQKHFKKLLDIDIFLIDILASPVKILKIGLLLDLQNVLLFLIQKTITQT